MIDPAQVKLAVRRGAIKPDGAYFATPGNSTYFDPFSDGVKSYDIVAIKILNWETDPLIGVQLLRATATLCTAEPTVSEDGLKRLERALEDVESGEGPYIDYMLADQTPMAMAAQALGYGGLMVHENDDWSSPSSVFIWDVSAVRELTQDERDEVMREQYPDLAEDYLPGPRM